MRIKVGDLDKRGLPRWVRFTDPGHGWKFGMNVSVAGPDAFDDEATECLVNWAALGAQPPEAARAYARLILAAADMAEGLTAEREHELVLKAEKDAEEKT